MYSNDLVTSNSLYQSLTPSLLLRNYPLMNKYKMLIKVRYGADIENIESSAHEYNIYICYISTIYSLDVEICTCTIVSVEEMVK